MHKKCSYNMHINEKAVNSVQKYAGSSSAFISAKVGVSGMGNGSPVHHAGDDKYNWRPLVEASIQRK